MHCPDPVRYDALNKTKQGLGVDTSSCPGRAEGLCHVTGEGSGSQDSQGHLGFAQKGDGA